MHELAVCQALLTQVERISREAGGDRVTKIILRIGPLSGIERELLSRAFDFARVNSPAAGAELCIEPAPVRIHCLQCDAEAEVAPNRLVCERCGGFRTRLVSGDELELRQVELWAEAAGARHH